MALTTRQLNNTGSPIVSAAGVPLSGVLIEFTLLDIYGNPTDTFDLTTGEMVYGSTSTTTDVNGLFTAQLWPNDRGTTSTAYRCIVHSPLIDGFLGTVASGATPLSWYTFRNQAVTYTPAQFTALDAHINNPTGAHAASAISNTPAGNISAVNVQTALNELDTKKGAVAGNLSQFAATTSAQLAGVLTDETGSGLAVFNNGPTLIAPVLGVATGTSFNSITALSSTTPAMDGAAAVGTGTTTARGDHVHPSDTSRALLAGSSSQTFSGAAATAAAHFVRLDQLSTGWIPDTNAWTYASASTFTVPTDQTGLYVPGLKIKWTDSGGVKYGVVLSSAFGAVTTVTILVNTSYVIANSAITAPSFSFGANPVSFPNAFAFAVTVAAVIPGATPPTWNSYAGSYYTVGRRIFYVLSAQVNAAGTGSGGISFGGLPVAVTANDGPGIGKENAVNGMMGVLLGGTNVFNLQTYSGGNPIVNSYYWLCQVNTYF